MVAAPTTALGVHGGCSSDARFNGEEGFVEGPDIHAQACGCARFWKFQIVQKHMYILCPVLDRFWLCCGRGTVKAHRAAVRIRDVRISPTHSWQE